MICFLFRNLLLYHSSSISAVFPSLQQMAVSGWIRCRHRRWHLQRCRAVSPGIRLPERSPARSDSCLSVVLDAVRNVQFVVHAAQIVNEEFYFLFRCLAAKFHLISDHCIRFFLLQSRLFALNAITFGRY